MSPRSIAVLGAGILGSCLAVNLARRGARVTLIDRREQPMVEASRYNEGKIHLGYLYGADETLRTARHLLSGGLTFGRLLSQLLECDITPQVTSGDDIYLVDRDSVVSAEVLGARFQAISALIREHPAAGGYLVDVSRAAVSPMAPADLAAVASERVVAGFRVPERSVHTSWVADQLAACVRDEPGVTFVPSTVVTGVDSDTLRVTGEPSFDQRFDVVVNALWGGRIAIDLTAGLAPPATWTHRWRWCLFVRTTKRLDIPSAIVVQGPFGDVKNYNGRDFYLSWYPTGLAAQGTEVLLKVPDPPSGPARERFIEEVRTGLACVIPRIGEVLEVSESVEIAGGHVFAEGRGSIGDPASGLHRRDRFGVSRRGSYFSVDTGKYSTAPWLADRLAAHIMED